MYGSCTLTIEPSAINTHQTLVKVFHKLQGQIQLGKVNTNGVANEADVVLPQHA